MMGEKKSGERKLSIAILLDKFLPSRGGERYFTFLAEELTRRGHDVHVFATQVEESADAPYQVHLIPVFQFPRSARMLSYVLFSARMVKRYGFDVIHGLGQSLACNLLNPHGGVERAYLKQEFASISSRPYYWYRWLRRYLSIRHYVELWLQKRLYSGGTVKRIIAISNMVKRDIIAHFNFPPERVAVVFNTVDLERFHPSMRKRLRKRARENMGISESEILFLFAGNNYRLKGLEPLLKALALLKAQFPERRLRLVVAGRGQRWLYKRMARKLGVLGSVLFPGPVREMEPYYAACDIYVHPTFYDSCSLTVLEALASGLPAVTTRFNGASDAITSDEAGRVIDDPRNIDELAKAIAFYFDEERRARAQAASRAAMEQYPASRNVEETLAVYYAVARDS
jgi:UDP-glucose:(heptosyl)LPS alpha-1,3-glucosyltransferase